jgi:hypothetical protein
MPQLNVTTQSVLCRLEHKELEQADAKHAHIGEAMLNGLKMNLDLQNGTIARENLQHPDDQKPIISLREWGCLITRIGLAAIAASEEDANEEEDAEDAQ